VPPTFNDFRNMKTDGRQTICRTPETAFPLAPVLTLSLPVGGEEVWR